MKVGLRGDFTNTGELEQIKSFNDWLERYPAKEKVVIAGNHDVTLHEEGVGGSQGAVELRF